MMSSTMATKTHFCSEQHTEWNKVNNNTNITAKQFSSKLVCMECKYFIIHTEIKLFLAKGEVVLVACY